MVGEMGYTLSRCVKQCGLLHCCDCICKMGNCPELEGNKVYGLILPLTQSLWAKYVTSLNFLH
jgi:hypothetical protein